MSVNIWDNSYEEKAQLEKCDLSARLKASAKKKTIVTVLDGNSVLTWRIN